MEFTLPQLLFFLFTAPCLIVSSLLVVLLAILDFNIFGVWERGDDRSF